ncbi:MAG: RNA polymerase sigma-70 factor [Bacteroidales bacterium]|jgi:RNA polymerase sigma-70 factor (ECF subfamily)|nr:RNA polymerase sigma-70 factor [Bacteroidales bacterium]
MKTTDKQFEVFYITYFDRFKNFAKRYVNPVEDAENIVQDIFVHLWEKREDFDFSESFVSYVFSTVKHRCIDFLRHKLIEQKTAEHLQSVYMCQLKLKLQSLVELDKRFDSISEIEALIQKSIDSLPEKCREIFIKNKIEKKTQKDIAKELNISVNTVESQMAIAYTKIRNYLSAAHYYPPDAHKKNSGSNCST